MSKIFHEDLSLISSVKSLGLREPIAKSYLALLELGTASAQDIASKIKGNRTSTYDLLEELVQRGLITYREVGPKRLYRCTHPERLVQITERHRQTANEILPILQDHYHPSKEQAKITYFDGPGEVAELYDQLAEFPQIEAIGNLSRAAEHLSDFTKYAKSLLRSRIKVLDIIEDSPYTRTLTPLYRAPRQQVRFMPNHITLSTDTITSGDFVAYISYGKSVHGVLIQSAAIAETARVHFELLWEQSTVPNFDK